MKYTYNIVKYLNFFTLFDKSVNCKKKINTDSESGESLFNGDLISIRVNCI